MKTKHQFLVFLSLVLLLASSIVGCGQFQPEAYQEGYKAGFTDGYEAGLAQPGAETVPTPSTTPETSPKTDTPAIQQAARTEFHNIQSAVIAMMVDNSLTSISNAANVFNDVAINLMGSFPDSTSTAANSGKLLDPNGNSYDASDKAGYLLYGHDIIGGDGSVTAGLVNYVTITQTKYYYTSETDGTVRQWDGATPSTATETSPKTDTPTTQQAAETEFHNVSSAVIALMTDNNLSVISNAANFSGGTAIRLMTSFPDSTSTAANSGKLKDPNGNSYNASDKAGYLLYGHDIVGDGTQNNLVNYVTITQTKYYYTCETDGTVRQWSDAALTTEYTY